MAYPPQNMTLRARGKEYRLNEHTFVMGILNVTPDSFSDGGQFFSTNDAMTHAIRMVEAGADMIDVGGESSRPGADPLTAEEEMDRVIPVIEQLVRKVDVPISIDTYKSRVAEAALQAGASIINDISAMTADDAMVAVVRAHRAPIILMHMRGTPKSMQADPHYVNVVQEVLSYLRSRARAAIESGSSCVIIDPGIGFGKTVQHNCSLLRHLRQISDLGYPVLVGPSRKSFLGKILGTSTDQRLEGTAAAVAVSIMNGANIIRVHDVLEMKRVAQVSDALARE
jgi:dihydropteroate synthase